MAVARVADISIHDGFVLLDTFRRYERRLQRLAEIECNGYPKEVTEFRDGKRYIYNVEDEKLRAKCERTEARLIELVKQVAKVHRLIAEFQGDPRGLIFRLFYNGQEVNYSI